MRKIIAFLLAVCLFVPQMVIYASETIPTTKLPVGYVDDEMSVDEIKAQIKSIYEKSRNSFGGSFSGYCGAYVGWQLYHMGINTSYVAPNGNNAWETYKNMTTTSGGYTVNKYSATNSTLKQVFNDLTANGTKNVYNIMLCLQKGNTQAAQTYGHVLFIHAIIDGVVYFSENSNLDLSSGYYAQGTAIAISIDSVCRLYTSTYIEGCTPQVEGVIHFTGTGNPNSVSVSWSEDTANSWFGNTDAKLALSAKISGSNQSGITEDGIYLYDYAGNELASCKLEESTTLTNTTVPVFFTVSQRLQYTLSPGTQYKYKMYITINGKAHESPMYSFTTTGTHSHKNGTEWYSDDTHHWKSCLTCGAESNKALHNYTYGICSVCGQIEEIPTEEEFYTYTVTDGKATITDIDSSISGDVAIPSTLDGYLVTCIEGMNCPNATSITIPKSVTKISEYAFVECTNLSSITVDSGNPVYHSSGNCLIETESKTLIKGCNNSIIPNDGSVTSIGNRAFQWCSELISIKVPNSVTHIGEHAFWGCDKLKNITLSNNITTIEYCAFEWCEQLESITIPDSVASISDFAFGHCENLSSVVLPKNLENIALEAFEFCTSLKSITIPANVVNISNWAFLGCENLENAYFENTEGWSVGLYGSDDIVEISSNDLADSKKAAEYLTTTHSNDNWICTEVECRHRVISDYWNSGLGFHWHECISCGETFDVERHVAVDGVCTICGEEVQAIADIESANATHGDTVIIEVELMDAPMTDALSFELVLPEGITLVDSSKTRWKLDGDIAAIDVQNLRGVWASFEEIDPNGTILSFEFKIEENAFLGANEIILEIYPNDTASGKTSEAVIELGGIIYVNEYVLGDIDGIEGVDAKDAVYLLYNVFFGDEIYPVDQPCDFDGDNSVTASDAIYLLYHVFFGDELYPLN